ncbi:MAG TPA: hypothetical protein VHE14_06695 [Solirubrobacteraceae bacterium]|nr:hypothetical protein [Solirubrobacteraceae bacterium]
MNAALLLLPRTLDSFILREQAEDLSRSPGVTALEAPRLPYGVLGRLPDGLARLVARVLARTIRPGGELRVVVIFHPFQLPLAEALLDRAPSAELWYSRWDRYEDAYDADPRTKRRLEALHTRAARRSAFTFVVSTALERLEHEAGREALVVPTPADSFPAPDPGSAVIAVSLGHLGWRVDWKLLRTVAERMPELIVLLVGGWRDDQSGEDEDYVACRALPNLLWLGFRPDEEAARLIVCADVGLLPFKEEPFNDAALPNRILKYARLGRRTIVPELEGVRVWERAVVRASGADRWVAALREHAGARVRPDAELREWALAHTAARQNEPLWERLAALGITQGSALTPPGSGRAP